MSPNHIKEVQAVMKRCQIGFPDHLIDDSNNLHADCYGTLGKLLHDLQAAHAEIVRLRTSLNQMAHPQTYGTEGANPRNLATSALVIK